MQLQRVTHAVQVAFVAVLLLAGADSAQGAPSVIVYGGDRDFAPFEFEGPGGEPTGFHVDLIRAAGREMGVEVRVELGPWPQITQRLTRDGSVDVASMYRFDEHDALVDYAVPQEYVFHEVYVKRGAPLISSAEELAGKRVSAQRTAYAAAYVRSRFPTAELVLVDSEPEALARVATGEADCALVSHVPRDRRRGSHGEEVVSAGTPILPVEYAMVVRRGRAELVAALIDGFASIHRTGEYDRIYARWFPGPASRTLGGRLLELSWLLVPASLGVALVLVWLYVLRRTVQRRTRALRDEFEQRTRAESAVREGELRYKSIFESRMVGMLVCDRAWNLVDANDVARRMLALDERQARGGTVSLVDLLSPSSSEVLERVRAKAEEGGTCDPIAVSTRAKDGAPVPVLLAAARIAESSSFVACLLDISERVAAERTLRESETRLQESHRMELVGRLAGGVAHDFNNLLTIILGTSMLLDRSASLAPEDRPKVADIVNAAHRGAGLTRQLLAFSRSQPLAPKPVDLNEIVRTVTAMLPRLLGEHIELVADLAPHVPPIEADTSQLEQLVLNLAVNARDAMPSGGSLRIMTALTTAREPAPPGAEATCVRLTVEDTGAGMDSATAKRSFEPFFTTKTGVGTGLGLAIVQNVVASSGAHLALHTGVGEGTRFEIDFPLADAASTRAPRPSVAAPRLVARAATGRGDVPATVLLVEDEAPIRAIERRVLEEGGFRVLEAADGAEALAIFDRELTPPALLVADVLLPRMGGLELVERLRARAPRMRVLFVSGYAGAGGAAPRTNERLLEKPFTPDALLEAARELTDVTAARPSGVVPAAPVSSEVDTG